MPLGDVDRLTKRNLRIRVGSEIKRDQQLAFEPEQLWVDKAATLFRQSMVSNPSASSSYALRSGRAQPPA